jgi:hypothetical protein
VRSGLEQVHPENELGQLYSESGRSRSAMLSGSFRLRTDIRLDFSEGLLLTHGGRS